MSLKQIRKRMYDTRNSKLRIQLMYLVRGLQWIEKEKATAETAANFEDIGWN